MSQDQPWAESMYVLLYVHFMSISVNATLLGACEDFDCAERVLDDEARAEETFP